MSFLAAHDPRPLAGSYPTGLKPIALHLGQGGQALEIAVFESAAAPTQTALKAALRERRRRRASPVLVVALHGTARAAVCGVDDEDPFVDVDLDRNQVERLCLKVLGAPDRHIATRALRDAFPQLSAKLPGLTNHGLFAMHELEAGVPKRGDWRSASQGAADLLGLRSRELMQGLGFTIRELSGADPGSVLVANGTKVAVAVFLERPDEIDPPLARFNDRAPISWALAKADEENLDYVVISAGSVLRVYPTKPGVGAGRRGRTETYVSLDLDLLRPSDAGYMRLICSAEALSPGGTFEDILARSQDFAAELGVRLRDRVYRDVVPQLARALVKAQRLRSPSAERLRDTYELVLRVLFRLLFVAYAEDNDRLPLHSNASYRKHSLKEIAKRLQQELADGVEPSREDFYWTDVQQLWKAVDKGNRGWGVPEYNGGLFSSSEDNALGAKLASLSLPDSEFVPALRKLLLDETAEGQAGPIDFRPLGVREFGTIYEGLLESELSVADVDLAVERGKDQRYIPAKQGAAVVVEAGEVYLHNASGARKSSGAYYTKAFAVEYLLERALAPAIDDHFRRLDALDDRDAAERLFEFRVADIAMGSGHFLVAALDHIERRFQNYLVKRSLPGVADELERLRQAAREQLGDEFDSDALEDVRLLRRQIARRCIFGVDLNPLAVELARLSIWIHSFVPGLPLSFLDGNLIVGNSLVGIATFDEAAALFAAGAGGLFAGQALERLASAQEPLRRLAQLAEATAKEVRLARALHDEARQAVDKEEDLLTVLAASRLDAEVAGHCTRLAADGLSGRIEVPSSLLAKARRALRGLAATHFPIAFPQVFLGARRGFDVIVGNPPWEKARVEEHEFWARYAPGLRGLETAARDSELAKLKRERADLIPVLEREQAQAELVRDAVRSFPGMATGHPDLFRAFLWRFLQLVNPLGGYIGIVLPGDAFRVAGAAELRALVANACSHVRIQMLTNKAEWVFSDVDPRKLVALVATSHSGAKEGTLYALPPEMHDLNSWRAADHSAAVVPIAKLREFSETLVTPLLPRTESMEVIERFLAAPRLRNHPELRVRRVYADFETSKGDRKYWKQTRSKGDWPVYKGESFDLWNPDTGTYYAYTEGARILAAAQAKRERAPKGTPYSETTESWRGEEGTHPVLSPRIAFRDVTNRTNTRTLVVALIPPKVVCLQTAPWILWVDPTRPVWHEAYLLGVLSSRVLDWWVRRFVEGHVDQHAFDSLRVPEPSVAPELAEQVWRVAGALAGQDERFAAWAKALGIKSRRFKEDKCNDLLAQLDAAVAASFDLSDLQLRHIFETFHEGWAYGPQLEATVRHLHAMKGLS